MSSISYDSGFMYLQPLVNALHGQLSYSLLCLKHWIRRALLSELVDASPNVKIGRTK
jgi:hypothetical protein